MAYDAEEERPPVASTHEVTRLLDQWSEGRPEALEELLPLVYDRLRSLAASFMRCILVAEEGVAAIPKIIDFGIAKNLGGTPMKDAPVSEVGLVVGTFGYLSPEVAKGEDADSRSDVFALGMVLYRLLVGVMPFDEKGTLTHPADYPPPSVRFAALGDLSPPGKASGKKS